jgi:predicted small lipoprotein YifL
MQTTFQRFVARLTLATLLVVAGCGGSSPPATPPGDTAAPADSAPDRTPPPPPESPPPSRQVSYRFSMQSPANDDFAFNDDDVHIYLRPYEDNLAIRIQGREQNFLRVYWDESEFIDILGRRYKLVTPDLALSEATFGIPPTDIPAGTIYAGRLLLLDPTDRQAIQRLGGDPFPVVPPDAGAPDQIRGQSFEVNLEIEVNGQRRTYPFTFEIRDAYGR